MLTMAIENIEVGSFTASKNGVGVFRGGGALKLFFSINHVNIYMKNGNTLLDKNDPKLRESQEIFEDIFEDIVRVCADTSTKAKKIQCLINEEKRILIDTI